MLRFVAIRLAQSALILLVMSFVVYALIGLMPGDPVDLMIASDPHMTSADALRLKHLYGLDRPILARYLDWLWAALHGDFGYSRTYAQPVLKVLLPALGNTLELLGSALALAFGVALPAGVFAARRPYSPTDYAINLSAFAGISMPPFWLALLLILLFSVQLDWLPAGGTAAAAGASGAWSGVRFMVLPVAALTLASVGGHTRYVRAAMIETLRLDFIRTARAKGLPERRVLLGHALQHAMIPVTTIVALDFGFLFSGALVTETVFAYPGMGKMTYDAILANDYNLALIALLFATLVTLLGNLLADLVYVWLDPRISYDSGAAA